MSYLGYDRARLAALRRHLGDLADEAAALRFPDPLAAGAARAYREAVALMTAWLGDLAAIDSCRFSSPYRPVLLDPADPALVDLLHPGDAAWTTVSDPRLGRYVSAADHARHLAEYLASVDVAMVLGDRRRADEVARLLANVMADSTERDAFLATLGADRFAGLAENLARRVAQRDASAEAEHHATAAAGLLRWLAVGFGAAARSGRIDGAAWSATLTEPYANALLVRDAGLAAGDLARLAVATWQRWGAHVNDDIDERAAATEQTPAILLAALTAQPVAARLALESFDDDDLALLFGAGIEPGGALPLLLASADPRAGTPDDVERSMVTVLDFLSHHRDLAGASGVSDGLGAYTGPYLEHLLGACDQSSYPARRWDLHGREPVELLGWIPHSTVAAASMEAYLDAIVVTRFAELAAIGPFDDQLVHHLGAIAGAVDRMIGDAHVLAAEHRNAIWRATGDTLAALVSTTGLGGVGVGPSTAKLIGAAVAGGVSWMFGHWQSSGRAGAPAPIESVVAAEGDSVEQRRGRREAAYLSTVFAAARSAGAMPASAAPPAFESGEPYLTTRNRWVGSATGPADAAARQQLWQAAEAFDAGMSGALNRFPSADACA